jgi:hypothetical protein
MRFTIVDVSGTLTFLAPPHALKALAAGCAMNPESINALLAELSVYDQDLGQSLANDLAIFQEHNISGDSGWIDERINGHPAYPLPVMALSASTKALSLQPGPLGLVIFNLTAKRIVQVQNSHQNVLRSDRGRIRRNGQPARALYRYTLPDDWSIVP